MFKKSIVLICTCSISLLMAATVPSNYGNLNGAGSEELGLAPTQAESRVRTTYNDPIPAQGNGSSADGSTVVPVPNSAQITNGQKIIFPQDTPSTMKDDAAIISKPSLGLDDGTAVTNPFNNDAVKLVEPDKEKIAVPQEKPLVDQILADDGLGGVNVLPTNNVAKLTDNVPSTGGGAPQNFVGVDDELGLLQPILQPAKPTANAITTPEDDEELDLDGYISGYYDLYRSQDEQEVKKPIVTPMDTSNITANSTNGLFGSCLHCAAWVCHCLSSPFRYFYNYFWGSQTKAKKE